jgi:hypothetical protein
MDYAPNKLTNMEVDVQPGGEIVYVRLTGENDQHFDLEFTKFGLKSLIESLTQVAYTAARIRTNDHPVPLAVGAETTDLSSPTSASNIGIAMAADRSVHLVLRFYDFDLTYRLRSPAKELHSIAQSLKQAAKTLGAPEKSRH